LSDPSDTPEVLEPVRKALRGSALPKAIVVVAVVLGLLLGAAILSARYGVLLPQGRLLLEARASGLKVGRVGRLKIEGIQGDVWRDFTVRRLTIADEKGVWLEARNVGLAWNYADLFRRRFHAERIAAEEVRVLRRPTLTPKGKSRGLPVSFDIDAISARILLEPAFSYRRGVYDLTGALDVERGQRGQGGRFEARSVLHPGDHLAVQFGFGKARPLHLVAIAEEGEGGALAGALGLPVGRRFALNARADGETSRGQFSVSTVVGDERPLEAQGAWSPQGGMARGRIQLSASTLTQGYARRFGPELGFALQGRRAGDQLFDLDARLTSQNLVALARGRGDLGTRKLGPQGIALDLYAPELTRLSGGPQMGPARARGRLTGTGADWRFEGDAEVTRFEFAGYTLQRAAGPVVVRRRNRVLTIEADASGAGGGGEGWLPAVLGARPRATFEGVRLADGRFLIKDVKAKGSGLDLEATGNRSLFGALTLKGDARIFNLPAARLGASGSIRGGWTAAQAKSRAPWTFSFDARGAEFGSGFAELDRLLGRTPRVEARGSYQDRRVAVSRAVLNGAAMDATGAGLLALDGATSFKLDWTARGPFGVGPVEVTGRAKGTGAITGRLIQPKIDLLADLESIDVPRLPLRDAKLVLSFQRRIDGSSGTVALTGTSQYGPAAGRSAFAFPRGGVDLTELAVNAGGLKAQGALSLRRRTPTSADLNVAVGPGAFLASGQVAGSVRLVEAGGGARADLDLTARNAVLPGSRFAIGTGRLQAEGPMARLPYTVRADGQTSSGAWNLAGSGIFSDAGEGYLVGFDGQGRFGGRDLRTLETATFRFGDGRRAAHLRLAAADGGRIGLDADLGAQASIRARAERLGLGVFNADLAGSVDATLTLSGRGGRMEGVLDARLQNARGRGSPAAQGLDGSLRARLAGEELAIDAAATNEQGLRANANLVLPAETSTAPFRIALHRQRAMRGRFFAEGEVKPLWDLLIGGERELAGQVRLAGTLSGSLAQPESSGQASVDQGRFADGATGLVLRDVSLRADFADRLINVTQALGVDGHGGRLSGAGRISLQSHGVSTFRLNLDNFRLIDNDQATAAASGVATIDRNAEGRVRLSGALTVNRADVAARTPTPTGVVAMDVIERNKPDATLVMLAPPTRPGAAVALDVTLKAPRRIFLRGRGLDVELSLDAHVGGTTQRPDLSGTARVVRGEYDFAGKRFEFDERGVVYLDTSPEQIRLDLSAVREDPSLTAVVRIRGTAAKPEILLTSTPVLPNDEVLSQVLFGRSASQLSPLEAAQLASALSSLAGGGGFDVIGNLRNFAGLDRLALGGGGEAGVTVSGGKYLNDDVYLELTGGGREGPAAQVEWRLNRNLSILSRLAGQGDGRLAVRWRKDY
jgi:translocation and assembly module TamB